MQGRHRSNRAKAMGFGAYLNPSSTALLVPENWVMDLFEPFVYCTVLFPTPSPDGVIFSSTTVRDPDPRRGVTPTPDGT